MKDLRTKIIFGGLLGLGVVIALLLVSDLRAVGTHLSEFPLFLLVPVLGLTLYNYAVRWFKWHLYLRLIGIRNISVNDSAALFVSGFVLALSPGKVAELLKAAVLRMMTGIPVARAAPVILAERVSDGLAMMLLAAIGFGGMALQSQSQHSVILQYVPAYLAVLGVLILGIRLIQFRKLFLQILDLVAKLPLLARISHLLRDLYQSSYELFRPVPLTWSVGLGLVSWAGECVAFFLILVGLGIPGSWLLLWQAMFILASSSIIGAISGLPGGLGSADFSILAMVNVLILGGQDAGLAGTAALLARVCTLWFGVLLGLITATVFRNRLFPERVTEIWQSSKRNLDAGDSPA